MMGTFCKNNRVQPLAGVTDKDTYIEVWRKFAHSLTSLLEGVHQPLDANGKAWPAGTGAAKYAGQKVCGRHFGIRHVSVLAYHREYAANETGAPIGDRRTVASGVLSFEAITTGGIEVVPNAAFKRKHGIGLPHASDVYI